MPTEVLVSIRPSGGTYTSLAACEAGENQNWVTADEYGVWEYQGDWSGGPDTGSVDVNGGTQDATHYIEIRTDASNRHAGAWDTNKAILLGNGSAEVLRFADDYTRGIGLQVETNSSATYGIQGRTGPGLLDKCLVDGSAGTTGGGCIGVTGSSGITLTVRSCATTGGAAGFFHGTSGTALIYNCTFYGATVGADSLTTNVTLINCLLQNNGTDVSGTANASSDYNCDEDGTAPGANSFTETASFVNAAAFDLHLASALGSQGTDLSGSGVTDDFDGDTRSNWDVGADEIVTSGGLPNDGTRRLLYAMPRINKAA